jgi:hypothetical protein
MPQLHRTLPPLRKPVTGFLDGVVKPFGIIALCLVGFVFEFLVELPFRVILAFHRRRRDTA